MQEWGVWVASVGKDRAVGHHFAPLLSITSSVDSCVALPYHCSHRRPTTERSVYKGAIVKWSKISMLKKKKSGSLNVVCQWLPKKARKEKSLFMSYSKREERVAKIYASLAFEIQIFYAGKQQDCVCQHSHAKLSCWAPEIKIGSVNRAELSPSSINSRLCSCSGQRTCHQYPPSLSPGCSNPGRGNSFAPSFTTSNLQLSHRTSAARASRLVFGRPLVGTSYRLALLSAKSSASGWSTGQLHPVRGNPAHGRKLELDGLLRFLSVQAFLWFCWFLQNLF